MVKKVKLSEILKVKTGKYDANHEDKNGKYDFFTCALKPCKSNTFSFDDEVIILPGNGANVGEVIYHNGKLEAYQRTYVLHEIKCNVKYLYYILKANWKKHTLKNEVGSATNYIKLAHITDFKIPSLDLNQQKKIAKTLDKVSELIELRKESITKLDALVKSIFIDMFGDPVSNPKKWELNKLSEFGNCKNGLNFDSKRNECNIKCLGVGDFKNLTTIRNIELLQTISIEKKPTKEYLLQNGDIIFVRSNGSKDLVGRCVEIYPNETEVTFGGFCIRFRLSTDLILIPYLLNVLKSKSMRQNMLGRGANIQNLNQQILLGLNIPLPPMELQNKFAKIIEKIEKQKSLYEKELELLQNNFDALLQKSFQE